MAVSGVSWSAASCSRYGLYPKKGTIAVGTDADIVLWDPKRKGTVRHPMLKDGCDYTPYEGMEITGWPVLTMLRGNTIMRDGEVIGEAGFGEEILRKHF